MKKILVLVLLLFSICASAQFRAKAFKLTAVDPAGVDSLDFVVEDGVFWRSPFSGRFLWMENGAVKVLGAGNISSVFGRNGAVVAQSGDYSSYYPLLLGSYSNPSWITSLALAKITGITTVGGNIVGAINPSAVRWIRINADNTITFRSAAETLSDIGAQASGSYQPLDTDLTAISGLSFSNDDFLQYKSGALANRTVAQVKTDLGLTGTNSGDQDLSVLLVKASNLSDLTSASTARTNLGLGSLATLSSINNSNWSGTVLSVANGGTGTATPSLVAGSNISITGTWPNQTVTGSSGGWAVTGTTNLTGSVSILSENNIFIASRAVGDQDPEAEFGLTNGSAYIFVENDISYGGNGEFGEITIDENGAVMRHIANAYSTSEITSFTVAPNSITVIGESLNFPGVVYSADYSANYTNRSLIDKGYADATYSSGGGHVIKEEGTPLTQRAGLNFVGAGFTASDDAGNDETDITLDSDLNTYAGITPSTIGVNVISSTNPSAITFLRGNADNTVNWLSASDFRTAIGAGTGSGTVTSVGWTGGIVSIANATTTPAFTIAGTSGGIPYFNSTTTWATSAALAANALVVGGGAGTAPSTTTTGTGVLTALGVNIGSAGAFLVNGGALGTPSSGMLTNASGLPVTGLTGSWTNLTSTLTGTAPYRALTGTSTLTGDITDVLGSQNWTLTSTRSTTNPIDFDFNSLTTGIGMDLGSTSSTTGVIVKAATTSTVTNHTLGTNSVGWFETSGANSTTAKTAIALSGKSTNTNATSGTNVGVYGAASGATTANYAGYFDGQVLVTGSSALTFSGAATVTIPTGQASAMVITDGTTTFGTFKSTATKTITFAVPTAIGGSATNDAAASGYVGEEVVAIQSTYTNFTTTATYQNITSITLSAGDWDISSFFTYSSNSATITAASNSIFVISTTTASAAGAVEGRNISYIAQAALLGTSLFSDSMSPYRVSISGSTTYYLNAQATFTLGNPQFVGGLRARRIR